MPSTKLILASASPRRAEILRDAGFTFTVISSAVDETPIPGESAQDLVQRLADAKAELVAARAVGPAIVIAADTAVLIDGEILGKPRTTDDARHMLTRLSGRVHSVVTGVTVIRLPDAERRSFVETTHVHFAPLSRKNSPAISPPKNPSTKPAPTPSRAALAATSPASKAATST